MKTSNRDKMMKFKEFRKLCFEIRGLLYLVRRDPPCGYRIFIAFLKKPLNLIFLLSLNSAMLSRDFHIAIERATRKDARYLFRKFYSHVDSTNKNTLQEMMKKVVDREKSKYPTKNHIRMWPVILYWICKISKPNIVMETGVNKGYSTALILHALAENRHGILYSIDLPPPSFASLGFESGVVVPNELKDRWELLIGKSQEIQPVLLSRVQEIDIFIHDSEHTYENMMFEWSTVWPHITHGGLLISDDVDNNQAFADFCRDVKAEYIVYGRLGIALKSRN